MTITYPPHRQSSPVPAPRRPHGPAAGHSL